MPTRPHHRLDRHYHWSADLSSLFFTVGEQKKSPTLNSIHQTLTTNLVRVAGSAQLVVGGSRSQDPLDLSEEGP